MYALYILNLVSFLGGITDLRDWIFGIGCMRYGK